MAKPTDLAALADLCKTTQTLLAHFQSSLAPTAPATPSTAGTTDAPGRLDLVKACTTLLKSHTTTLSLLLLTPPFTPSAITSKIGDVSSGPLTGLVGAATSEPAPTLGTLMQAELRAQVRQLLAAWGDAVALILRLTEARQRAQNETKSKAADKGPTESERQAVLSATGVVWEACDALVGLCDGGIAGLAVTKAHEWRSVLLDAVQELHEWGDDVANEEEEAERSDGGLSDQDDEIFGPANKLRAEDRELKSLLDKSVKKLKMIGMLYQALIKRRLKPFPTLPISSSTKASSTPIANLEELMALLKSIPDHVDDLASAFYDLDEEEAKSTLEESCQRAKAAVTLVKQSWTGTDDEFTAWSARWVDALEAAP